MSRKACQHLGVVDEVFLAFRSGTPLVPILGFILGGIVPVATYLEAHYDMSSVEPLHVQTTTYLVLGGLVFSAKTVFQWLRRAWRDGWKAAAVVLILEGIMVQSSVPVLPWVILAILVAINGTATACILSLDRQGQKSRTRTISSNERRGRTAMAVAPKSYPGTAILVDAVQTSAESRTRRRRASSPQARFSFDIAS